MSTSALADAMTDLVGEVRGGAKLEAAAAAIAPDYGFHPSLLVRKFNEAYPCGLPKLVSPQRMASMEDRLIERTICERTGLVVKITQFDDATRRDLRRICGL